LSGNGTEDDRNGRRQHDRKGVEREIAGGKLVYIDYDVFEENDSSSRVPYTLQV
jgi:hypothetical protein